MPAQTRSLVYSRAAKNVQQFHQRAESFFQPGSIRLALYKLGHFWPGLVKFVSFPEPKSKADHPVNSPRCPKRSVAYLQDFSRKLAPGSVYTPVSSATFTKTAHDGVCSSI